LIALTCLLASLRVHAKSYMLVPSRTTVLKLRS